MSYSRKIVIEGIFPYGKIIAERLANQRRNDDVYIIGEDEEQCKKASETLAALVLKGKITDGRHLDETLGNFDVFIAAHEDDGKNLLSCLYVKDHCNTSHILSIVQDEEAEETFANHGIKTVSPEKAACKILLRYMAGDPKLIDRITTSGQSELIAFEIKEGSKLEGKDISMLPLKPKDYNIVCVLRAKEIIFAKHDYTLKSGDILQIAVDPKRHKKLQSYK